MTENILDEVRKLCYKYYSKRNLAHVLKVEEYIMESAFYIMADEEKRNYLRAVALAHDLLEDTECIYDQISTLDSNLADSVLLLTNKEEDYLAYIDNILKGNDGAAILVKLYDIKDHFMRVKTLTPKLEKKYRPAAEKLLKHFNI